MEGGKVTKWAEDLFFVLFCFLSCFIFLVVVFVLLLVFFFVLFLFCYGFFFFFAFHFSKPLKFVLGLPKWKFSTRKKHFMLGKKSGKMTLPPLKNIPVMPPARSSQKPLWVVTLPLRIKLQSYFFIFLCFKKAALIWMVRILLLSINQIC